MSHTKVLSIDVNDEPWFTYSREYYSDRTLGFCFKFLRYNHINEISVYCSSKGVNSSRFWGTFLFPIHEQEEDFEKMMHGLAADLSVVYEKFAPQAFDNQVHFMYKQ